VCGTWWSSGGTLWQMAAPRATASEASAPRPKRLTAYEELGDNDRGELGMDSTRGWWGCCGARPLPLPAVSAQASDRSMTSNMSAALLVNEPAASREAPEGYLENKGTVLSELDAFLGYSTPPAIEYVFVENVLPDFGLRWFGVGFGHAAVRYTLPSGEQRLVNITRGGAGGIEADTPLVQIYEDPADYLFGVDGVRPPNSGAARRRKDWLACPVAAIAKPRALPVIRASRAAWPVRALNLSRPCARVGRGLCARDGPLVQGCRARIPARER